MYHDGLGVAQDDTKALQWLRLAAEQGLSYAQYNLGVVYHDGLGVAQDDAEAVRWFRLSAEQGDAEAQNNLGAMYRNGQGVPQDDAEAVRLYRLAAEQGDAEAQNNLGVMYANGQGVPQDDAEAARWYRLAAEQGNAEAKQNHSVLQENSQGVLPDFASGAFFIGALFLTWLVSRGLLALTKNWIGGLLRLASVHAASLALVSLVGGMGMADGGPFVAKQALSTYFLPQIVWLAIDSWRLQKRERRETY